VAAQAGTTSDCPSALSAIAPIAVASERTPSSATQLPPIASVPAASSGPGRSRSIRYPVGIASSAMAALQALTARAAASGESPRPPSSGWIAVPTIGGIAPEKTSNQYARVRSASRSDSPGSLSGGATSSLPPPSSVSPTSSGRSCRNRSTSTGTVTAMNTPKLAHVARQPIVPMSQSANAGRGAHAANSTTARNPSSRPSRR